MTSNLNGSKGRLQYAKDHHGAAQINIFAHHPWFLYDENEATGEMHGESPFSKEWHDERWRLRNVIALQAVQPPATLLHE